MTSSELAILSLVVQEPRHGYQVEQIIKARGMRDWADIGFSSIYYLLGKLEGKGWISGEAGPAGGVGPARKVYRVTPDGVEAWRQGVLDVLSIPRKHSMPLQVGLANLPALPRAEVARALARYRQRLVEREKCIRGNLAKARSKGGLPWHAECMFDLSLTMTRAELAWVQKLVRKVSPKPKGTRHA